MRVLCLHGFGTNASIMKKQLTPLILSHTPIRSTESDRNIGENVRSVLGDRHTFETIDAPIAASDTFDNVKFFFPDETEYYQWFTMDHTLVRTAANNDTNDASNVQHPYTTESVENAIEYLKPRLNDQDCVLGFSQGGAVVSVLLQRRLIRHGIVIAHGRMVFAEPMIDQHVLHLIGTKDPFREWSESALLSYTNTTVHRFVGDHKIPYDTESIRRIAEYLDGVCQPSDNV